MIAAQPPRSVSVTDRAATRARNPARPWQAAVQGKGLELVGLLLLVTVLPRVLGPTEYGRLLVALTILTLGSYAISLGAPSAFVRFIPAEPPERRAGLARSMTLRLLRLRAVQLAVAAAIALGLALAAPDTFPALQTALVFAALVVETGALLAAQTALGLGRTGIWSYRLALQNAVLLTAVPLLFLAAGLTGAIAGLALASLAGLLFAGSAVLLPLVRAERGVPIPEEATRFGIVTGSGWLLAQLTYRAPVLAAALLAGSAAETGFAALAASVALAVMLVVRQVFTVSLPDLVERWEVDRNAAGVALRRITGRMVAILVPAALLSVVLLDPVLPLIAGEDFAGAATAFVPALALLPLLPIPVLGWQTVTLGLRPELALKVNAIGLLAFAAAAGALVPVWEGAGATTALLVAVGVTAVLTLWRLPSSVSRRVAAAAAGGAVAVIVLGLVLDVNP